MTNGYMSPMSRNFVGLHRAWKAIDCSLLSTAAATMASGASIITLGYCTVNAIIEKSFWTANTPLFIGATIVGMLAPTFSTIHRAEAEGLAKCAFNDNAYSQEVQPTIALKNRQSSDLGFYTGAFIALCAVGFSSPIPYAKAIFGVAAAAACLYGAGREESLSLDVLETMRVQPARTPAGPS